MKPRIDQYVLAHTMAIITGTPSLLVGAWVIWNCANGVTSLASGLWLAGIVVLAMATGWLLAFLMLAFLGRPIWLLVTKLNGGPFQVNDRVRILSGHYRNRVGRVYEVWGERGQVRVAIDEQAQRGLADTFSTLQVCRE